MTDYDVVVIGLGCAGLAACTELAKRDKKVLGIDKYRIVNDYGSSHGDIRLFRFAYHEGKEYIPLLYESRDKWNSLTEEQNKPIFEQNGSATIGETNTGKLNAAQKTCESADIEYTLYNGAEFSEMFPMWDLSEDFTVLYQQDGGIVHSRRGLHELKSQAIKNGVTIQTQTNVRNWEQDTENVKVTLDTGKKIAAESLVFTTGPWAEDIDELKDLLTVERHLVSFLDYPNTPEFSSSKAPVWVYEDKSSQFYGAPDTDSSQVKLGNLDGDRQTTIDSINRNWSYAELAPEANFSRKTFSKQPESITGEVCPLTHTPDGNFIIDSSNTHKNVFYGVGLSGHGLKLAPAIGRLIADCVVDKHTNEMFSLNRFSTS